SPWQENDKSPSTAYPPAGSTAPQSSDAPRGIAHSRRGGASQGPERPRPPQEGRGTLGTAGAQDAQEIKVGSRNDLPNGDRRGYSRVRRRRHARVGTRGRRVPRSGGPQWALRWRHRVPRGRGRPAVRGRPRRPREQLRPPRPELGTRERPRTVDRGL